MERNRISEAELEIMKALWEGSPKTAAEIIETVKSRRDWSQKTIRTMIDRLVQKNRIEADRSQAQLRFSPLISKSDYERMTRKSLADQLYDGSIGKMLISFVDQKELEPQEIEELKALLEKMGK